MTNEPTTPCVRCFKAVALGSNVTEYYGEIGDMCPDCDRLFRKVVD